MSTQHIYISGLNSGQNPCAGLGIARCLRKAYPDFKLIGVDHWQGSSGLHHDALDEVLLFPAWNQIDQERHRAYIRGLLDAGHIWIPALDVELTWLSQNLEPHPNLLAPTRAALDRTCKPEVAGFQELGFNVPEFISAFVPDEEAHAFFRHNSWRCWLKGRYHDAKQINSWASFERQREAMQKEWNTNQLVIQRHVPGHEESICFAAYQGKLLAAVHMQKRIITSQGKTWAGKVTELSPELTAKLKVALEKLNWTGGGEIEYVQDLDGKRWIIECNPRFPAWIYGSAIAHTNLPALLVAGARNLPYLESPHKPSYFTRVVQEIPVKDYLGLPPPPEPTVVVWGSDSKGKGGSVGQPSVIPPLRDPSKLAPGNLENSQELPAREEGAEDDEDEDEHENERISPELDIPAAYQEEVETLTQNFSGMTPARIHLEEWTMSRFDSLAETVRGTSGYPKVRIAYSVKTSSTDDHLRKARESGFLTECISQGEIHRALGVGTKAEDVILNGPGKFWPLNRPPVQGLHMLFCDSVEEFDRVLAMPGIAAAVGFRIRLPKITSRFGVPVEDFATFQRIVTGVRKMSSKQKLGFHFHLPSWLIGVERWKEAFNAMIMWSQAVEHLTKKPVSRLDLGGGFFPSDLEGIGLSWVQAQIREKLPSVEAVYFEPGRSLTQEGEAVISTVLDVRRSKGKLTDVVVDASIAELPLIQSYAHRAFVQQRTKGREMPVLPLGKGDTRILGRICMENDILSDGIDLPQDIEVGDLIVFGDAGAYERTMAYDFGRG